MIRIRIWHFLIAVLTVGTFSSTSYAHRSGCHRWHSCPSDSGSYTCGDTGHCSSCPNNEYCENGQPRSKAKSPNTTKKKTSNAKPQITRPLMNRPSLAHDDSGCDSGHWIDTVSSDGEIITLEDGSIWRVDTTDTVDSALWLPTTEIVVCDDKLINTDDNESVGATKIN